MLVRRLPSRDGERRFAMGARRGPLPVRWEATQRPLPDQGIIEFTHTGGVTRGMQVAWRIVPGEGGMDTGAMLGKGANPSLEQKLELSRVRPGPPVDVDGEGRLIPCHDRHAGAIVEDFSLESTIDHQLLIGTSDTNLVAASIEGKVRDCKPWSAHRAATSSTFNFPNPVSAITKAICFSPAPMARGSHFSFSHFWSSWTITLTFLESLTKAAARWSRIAWIPLDRPARNSALLAKAFHSACTRLLTVSHRIDR